MVNVDDQNLKKNLYNNIGTYVAIKFKSKTIIKFKILNSLYILRIKEFMNLPTKVSNKLKKIVKSKL